MHNKVYLVV